MGGDDIEQVIHQTVLTGKRTKVPTPVPYEKWKCEAPWHNPEGSTGRELRAERRARRKARMRLRQRRGRGRC